MEHIEAKKILIVTQEFPPRVGGAGVVGYQNARALASLGHEVTVVSLGNKADYQGQPFKIIVARRFSKVWIFALYFILKCIKLNSVDTIILNDIGASLVFALFFNNKNILAKTLIYLHGGEPSVVLQKPNFLYRVVGFRQKYLSLLHNSKALIAVSNYMRDYLIRAIPGSIDLTKFQVVYAGVDSNIFNYSPMDLHQQLGIPQDHDILLSVSRIVKEKGYDMQLKLFSQIVSVNPKFHWLIIGDGPYLAELQKLVKDKNLNNNVTFLGKIRREELPKYYSSSNLLWLLSRAESFGLVFTEAQMCGLPVLALKISGVVEAVVPGITGFLVDDASESITYILNREYYKLSPDKIFLYSRTFDVRNTIKGLALLL